MATSVAEQKLDLAKFIEKGKQRAVHWGPRLVALCIVTVYLLDYLYPKENLKVGLGLIAGLFVLLSEKLEQSNRELAQKIESNILTTQSITESVLPRLYTMQECIYELTKRSHDLKRGDLIKIRHIGLDMAHAWDHVVNLLSSDGLCSDVDYELLILTHDATKLGHVEPTVDLWCNNVARTSLRIIRDDIKNIAGIFRNSRRRLEFSCKEYVYMPLVHGFEVSGEINLCYVAICRWGGPSKDRLDWGETQYVRIVDSTADPVQSDLRRTFRSFFDRHWLVNKELAAHTSQS